MRNPLLFTIILLLAGGGHLLFVGCRGQGKELPFRVLSDSQSWALRRDEPAYFVVTEKNWGNYYSVLPPGTDLANNFYVVAFWGTRPNPGYRISIMALRQLRNRVQVAVNLEEPEPGKFYAQVLVCPIAVGEVDKKSVSNGRSLTFQFLDQKGSQLARLEVEL